jgi:mannose-6-phosphate isomerase-like protein (cupin superfamily)
MLRTGDTLHNPVTGERLVFHATAAETNGMYTIADCYVSPDGAVAAPHVHPHQTEVFEVLYGRIGVKINGKKTEAGAGEVIVIEAGAAHKFWNAGEDELCFRVSVNPSLGWEQLIETMYTLAADGKTNKKGMPNPVRLAVIANHHFDDVRLPKIPHALQKLGLVLGAPVGRLFGFAPTFDPIPGELAPAAA